MTGSEYAKEKYQKVFSMISQNKVSEIEKEIEQAFEAGYRLGQTDAHRKESVCDVQENFARELR